MAIGQTGTTISLANKAFYKGGETHNGTLLDMHENCIKYGYSKLVNADGTDNALVPFGYGVWLNTQNQNNRIYAGVPTEDGATPIFAGIIEREPATSGSIVWNGYELSSDQNGMVVVDGVIQYKRGTVFNTGIQRNDVSLASFVYPGFVMAVSHTDGKFYFTPKATVLIDGSDLVVGRVLRVNKEVGYVDVYVSPSMWGGITGSATITSFTAGTPTATTVPTTIVTPSKSVLSFSYKKTADSDYTDIEGEFVTVYDEANSNYKFDYEFSNLVTATAYTFKVVASTPNGLATTTCTETTA